MKTIVNEETSLHPVKMPLTEKELLAYADELTAVDTKAKDVQLRHDGEKNRYKAEMKGLSQEEEKLLNLLKTKEEVKQVDCYNDFDWFSGIVTIRRTDNHESVTTRKITAEEFQQNLPLRKGNEE